MDIMYIILPLIGFIGMFSGGFWSVGCGWLIVPTMLIFGFTPNEAVGVGLLQMVPSILPSVIKEVRQLRWDRNSVAVRLVIPLGAGAFCLAFSGKFINEFFYVRFGSLALLIIFCCFMIFLGITVLFGKVNENESQIPKFTKNSSILAFVIGMGAGVLSSVMGVGGAVFFRPVLVNLFKVPEQITSKAIRLLLLITTFTGGMFYTFSNGTANYKIISLAAVIAVGGMIGFPLGVKVHNIVIKNGYLKYINKSFATVAFIVLTNTILNITGYVVFSRYLMVSIAVVLFIAINLFKLYTDRHKINQ